MCVIRGAVPWGSVRYVCVSGDRRVGGVFYVVVALCFVCVGWLVPCGVSFIGKKKTEIQCWKTILFFSQAAIYIYIYVLYVAL